MIRTPLPWLHPLDAARALGADAGSFALLYSGKRQAHTGRYSYLALYPQESVTGSDFAALADRLSQDKPALENAWFGYLGYEMLHAVETLPREANGFIALPDLWFTRFGLLLRFDHENQTIECWHEPSVPPPHWPPAAVQQSELPAVARLSSAMTRGGYLDAVAQTKEAIARGDFYQANITRKFTGEFASAPDAFALFCRLAEVSPAAMSAFIKMGDAAIVSSSPETFLHIAVDGRMESYPIKGTAPRLADEKADAAARAQLETSEKDRAENLMIVDLMRNDLARACTPGSVHVDKLFEVTTYATLHHMASTVSGQKRSDVSTLGAVRGCFPPGSMTGAPKIRAMQWCLAHERIRRGIYSGALGWFGGDGSCDLSVVIRTLIVQGNRFEFQVGGGIVADSEPEAEWRETLTKARGICAALGVDMAVLEGI